MNRWIVIVMAVTVSCLGAATVSTRADAGVRMDKEAALQLAFSGNAWQSRNLFLTDAEMQRVESLSGQRPNSALYTFYVGQQGDLVTGYASIEAVTIRTQPATVLVVLEPDGRLRFVEVLAFFEPQEYLPSQRWLDQFGGKALGPELRVDGGIHGISGATLSAQSLTRQARKVSALLAVYLERQQ